MSIPLRIFYLANTLPAHGGSCSIEHLAPELVRRGHRLWLFVRDPIAGGDHNQYLVALRTAGVRVQQGTRAGSRVSAAWLWLRFAVARFLHRPHLAMVLRSDSAFMIDWLRALAVPTVYVDAIMQDRQYSFERWFADFGRHLCKASLVVVPSPACGAAISAVHGVAGPFATIPFAIPDPHPFPVSKDHAGGLALVTTGRLDTIKGIDYLLDAVARLEPVNPVLRLRIRGSGRQRDALQRFADRLGITGQVALEGAFDNARDLPRIMAGADIFVLPSRNEGFPLGLLEAMAWGKAIVATAVGGTVDLIEDGVTGLLVPARDSAALADAIRRLAADGGLRRRLGSAARERFLRHYTPQQVVPRLEHAWQEAIRRPRGRYHLKSHVAPAGQIFYRMGDAAVQHNTGDCILDRQWCHPDIHEPGHCVFGIDYRVTHSGRLVIGFEMELDAPPSPSAALVNLEIYDNTSRQIIDFATITAGAAAGPQRYSLQVDVTAGQVLEPRVWWHGNCVLEVSRIEIRAAPLQGATGGSGNPAMNPRSPSG